MCDTNMHQEALRKTRVLERRAIALQRMDKQQVDDMPCVDMGAREHECMAMDNAAGLHALHAEQARVSAANGVGYNCMQYDHSRNGPTRPITWYQIERQLRSEAKVLRDHNLYMGHTSAFKDLYDRGMLEPGQ